jgi:putative transcriptional regulator
VVYLLERDTACVEKMAIPERRYPIRMWYMYKNQKCTLIEIDESTQNIFIKNYTNNIQFRAFGVNETPDYKDYLLFLESRCFPASRDKMKLILKDLDLPFYDPFMIIKKTKGKMAEDDFWIEIEE